jgi:predicted O-methyltransferase YrrM
MNRMLHAPSASQAHLYPWMRADEVEAIRSLLHARRPRRVLEFGAGGSTLTFAREPSIREWWSLEHSPKWVCKVLSAVAPSYRSKITLVSCPEDNVILRLNQLLPIGFDMFFVDGFDRCLILDRLRSHLTKERGLVLLHDSSRSRYRRAIRQFPKRTVLTEGDGRHQGLMVLET